MHSTSAAILAIGVPLAIYLALIVPTLTRLFKGVPPDEYSIERLRSFSPAIYLPMERLLSAEDFAFFSRQPGFDLSLYRKLRRDRLTIFRQYLHRMIVDFNRLHLAARLAVSQSDGDHSELLPSLVALKIRFSAAVIMAELRCTLCFFGLRTLSARVLILQLEELNSQLQLLRPTV